MFTIINFFSYNKQLRRHYSILDLWEKKILALTNKEKLFEIFISILN